MNESAAVEQDGEAIVIRIPLQMKKRRGRKEIILPEGMSAGSKSRTQEPLLIALARAFHWQELLDRDSYSSITCLATALDVDRSYVGRILRLTLLAPDIVEAIVAGREPSGLSLERLVKGVPVNWEEQREEFGI